MTTQLHKGAPTPLPTPEAWAKVLAAAAALRAAKAADDAEYDALDEGAPEPQPGCRHAPRDGSGRGRAGRIGA